jgi:hypothetical protein
VPFMTRLRVAFIAITMIVPAASAHAQRAVQLTPPGSALMINKPVGSQMWSIVVNFSDQTIAGNVFNLDGSDPQFVSCDIVAPVVAAPQDFVGVAAVTLDCQGAGGCGVLPCTPASWTSLGQVQVVGSFFLPPSTGAPVPTATPHNPTPIPTLTPLPQQDSLSGLIGTWQFNTTILSTVTDTYRLQKVVIVNGTRALQGLDEFGDPVVAARVQEVSPGSPLPYEFTLLDPGILICNGDFFNRTGSTTITGVNALMFTDAAGNCDPSTITTLYPLDGTRISISAATIGAERLGGSLVDSLRTAGEEARGSQLSSSEAASAGDPASPSIRAALAALLKAAY